MSYKVYSWCTDQDAYSPHRIECSSTQCVFFLSVRFIIMEMYIIVYVTMPKRMVTQRARLLFAQSNKDTQAHIQEVHTPIHVRRNSCILSSTRYPVNHKQQRQHMWHLNEHRSPRKPHSRLHTRSHYETHTEKRSRKSRYDLSSIAQLLFSFFVFVLLSNVVCTDIHHLDDILMSHPQAVSISPPLSLFPLPPTRRPSLHK